MSAACFHGHMPRQFLHLSRRTSEIEISEAVAAAFRSARKAFGWTQAQVAERAEVSRSLIAKLEAGRRAVSIASLASAGDALGMTVEVSVRTPLLGHRQPRDVVHARCCRYVERHLRALGWRVAREVPIGGPRPTGWIDVLAVEPSSGALLVIEVKTVIDDVGAIERKLGWYSQAAIAAARGLGWGARHVSVALLCLDSTDVRAVIARNLDLVSSSFTIGAPDLRRWLGAGAGAPLDGRALVLIDPLRRGRRWMLGYRPGGGEREPAYRGYADAAARLAGQRRARRVVPGSAEVSSVSASRSVTTGNATG